MNSSSRTPPDEHLDADNPWPGLASFQEENHAFFFGREQEIQQFARLVRRELLCVLFGKSGLGKSSLLKAGLFPLLREELYVPIYIRLNHVETTPPLVEQVTQAICSAIREQGIDAPLPDPGETLWQYFHRRDVDWWDEKNRLLTPVLVFDQFEEILTLGFENLTRSDRSRALLTELEDVVENRIPDKDRQGQSVNQRMTTDPEYRKRFVNEGIALRVILTLREDFLPDLEELRGRLRPVLLNRFRLLPMTEEQARSVISDPSPGLVPEDAVNQIVTALSSAKSVFRAKDYDLFDREFDPALLSVVCQQLNNHRRQNEEKQITANVVIQGKDQILKAFYQTGFEGLPKEARFFVEDQLLDESGFRIREALPTALNRPGITEEIVRQLINRRLIRQEVSHDHEWLELSHDVLAGVAKESRSWRRNQELLWKARRRLIISAIVGGAVSVLAIVMGFLAWQISLNVHDLKLANDRFLLEQASQFLTNAADSHETAAVYKLLRQFKAMKINVPQTDALLALLPPQRWKPARLITIPTGECIHDVLFSPDGQYLAALTTGGNLFISDQCQPNYTSDKSDPDFRQVLAIGTNSTKSRCRAIAFNPVDNDHRLTIRTIDNQFLSLDCAAFTHESAHPVDEVGHLEATVLSDASSDVADNSIAYFYNRLFILSDDNTLEIRDKSDHENTVELPEDLSAGESDQRLHRVKLFESGASCESKPILYFWRNGTLNVVSFDKDFTKINLVANGQTAERVDQFAVGATGVAAEYHQADDTLEVTSYVPARRTFRLQIKDFDKSVQEPGAIAVGTSSDILVCSADGTIQNFLLNAAGTFSGYATLRAPAPVTAISFRSDQAAFVTGSCSGQVLIWCKYSPPVGQNTLALVRYAKEQTDQLTGEPAAWNISPSGRLLVLERGDGIYRCELKTENSSPVLTEKKQDRVPTELYFDIRIDDDGRITTLTSTKSTGQIRIRRDSVDCPVTTDVDFCAMPVLSPDGSWVGYISRDKISGHKQLTVRNSVSGSVKNFPLGEFAQEEPGSRSRAAIIAFDRQSRRVAIFDAQLERLEIFDLENPAKEPDSIAVPLTSHLDHIHFTKDGSGLILSFSDSTLALVDIPSPLLLGPFSVPSYSVVGDSPRGIVVFDRDGMLNGSQGFAMLAKRADDQIEQELELASFGNKMSKRNGIYAELESLDDFRAQIQKQIVLSFSISEAQKWTQLRDATRSFAALSRTSSAEEVFQILDKVSPLSKAGEFPDEYEPQVLQIAWRVSRNLHEKNVSALPTEEFENLPAQLRIIFDNAITALNPDERSAKIQRACDLADLFYSGEKLDSPTADECLSALREAVGNATADDLAPNDKARIKRHFGLDLRTRSEFPSSLLREKGLAPSGVNAPRH